MPWGTKMMTFFASEATLTTGGGANNPLFPFQVHAGYVMFWALLSLTTTGGSMGACSMASVDISFFGYLSFGETTFAKTAKETHAECMLCRPE